MSPRLLKSFLRDVAIYERIGEGQGRRYRVRLMGTAFAQILGDLTGKFIDEAIPAGIRRALACLPRRHARHGRSAALSRPRGHQGHDVPDRRILFRAAHCR